MSAPQPTPPRSDLSTGPPTAGLSRPPSPDRTPIERVRPLLRRQALGLVALYVVAAGAWIAVSDVLLGAVIRDPSALAWLGLAKGLGFVAATAALLHAVLRRHVRMVEASIAEVARKEAERAHHEIERRRTEAIVESTGDAVISCDVDGIVTGWNPAAARMLGHDAAAMCGQPARSLVPPELADEEAGHFDRVRRGDRIERYESMRLRADGAPLPVSVTRSPMLALADSTRDAPVVVGVSEIIRDISKRTQAEAVAAREQGFARALIESMPGVFYLYDRNGRFLRWNRNLERVSGYSTGEIAALKPEDLFASRDHARLRQRIEDVFVHGESQLEAALVAKGGAGTPYYFTGRRIEFDGEPCLVGVGVDIGERVRAEAALTKSEERYRSTLDNILEGCQLLDFDWRYLYLNDAAALQNRRPNAELLGVRMPDAWPGIEDSPLYGLLERGMRARVAVHGEIEFVFVDGTKGWFDVRAQPVPEGLFVLSIDISERKQAEQALRELYEGLERIVAERTVDLEAARERAEAADRVKSAFLATMSHELRTPLNSILGFTGIIRQGLAGPVTDEQSKQLGMVQSSARHLLDLINDVLDISKIEAGQLEVRIAQFDLGASVARVAASVQPMAEKKGLAIRVVAAELPAMHSDRRRVEQILLNLLNNAIKFTDTGEVTLTVTCTASGVAMCVADTGIGIRDEDLALLFVPFRQIDTGLQRQHEGTGLGLAICRRLTALLGGTITAKSRVGQGSAFTVELPQNPEVTP